MDNQVARYRDTAYHNVHAHRTDNQYPTSAQPAAVVGRRETPLSEGQHCDNLFVLVR